VALTNHQIERYSRQLIVKDFGGIAQERLLAARVLLLGTDLTDTGVLAYLVGAGVGNIDLPADCDPAACAGIIARMRDLNPDSTVRIRPRAANESGETAEFDLALVLAGDDAAVDQARALYDRPAKSADNFAIVLARLDQPARIAVIPRRPPCPRCARAGDLLGPIGARSANAGFVASLAALEALKHLARFAPAPNPTLIEFRGYESSARKIDSASASNCACAAILAAENS